MEAEGFFRLQGPSKGCCYNTTLAQMRREDILCDVTIKTENQSFRAHRAVLAAASSFFTAMFTKDYIESRKEEIFLTFLDSQSLGYVIDFIYYNNVRIPRSKVASLLQAALCLEVDLVLDGCIEYLLRKVNPDNVLIICRYAGFANKPDVKENADRYVRQHFEDVSKCEQFKRLSSDELINFISRDDLFVVTEEVIFDAVINWVKSSEGRLDSLAELLRYVRMPLLTSEFLDSRISSEPLIRASPVWEHLRTTMHKSREQSLAEESNALYDIPVRERYCKEKHHMKCLKLAGCGLYALCEDVFSTLFIIYYDSVNRNWAHLYNIIPNTNVLSVQYVVSTMESIYILTRNYINKLDLETLDFNTMEHDGTNYTGAGIAYHNGLVYLFGGLEMPHKVQTLDLENGEIMYIGILVVSRFNACVASLENSIFIIGGNKNRDFPIKSVEKFDVETKRCTVLCPLLRFRIQCSCASLKGKIYVCGGALPSIVPNIPYITYPSTEVYDPLTDRWTFVRQMNIETEKACLIPYNGKLQAFGNVPASDNKAVETYDPETDEWNTSEVALSDLEVRQISVAVLTNSAAWPITSRVPVDVYDQYFPWTVCFEEYSHEPYRVEISKEYQEDD